MRLRVVLLLFSILYLLAPAMEAQEDTDGEPSLFDSTITADIETAGITELLDWARSLGISTRGGRSAVEDRILQYYGLTRQDLENMEPGSSRSAPPEGASLLRIDRARGSEFFTLEESNEDYLRLTGGVVLTLEEGDTVHRIEAQQIILNLEENTLAALGAVQYSTERPDGTETFRGDSIVFEIDTWAGVFIQGITETRDTVESEEVEFSVQGDRITRSADEIIVIDGGRITSSRARPPNYQIRARRIWVLAPGEWGLRSAVLYVGRVPTFYLPVFFLPGDRLFFHPAVGSRTRDGAFIQTTTYFIGQSEEADPPLSLMSLAESPDESERVIQGLFLRIPDEPPEPDPPGWTLKAMVDLYTRLGAYTGVAATMPDLGPLTDFDWRVGLAASRTIYETNGQFSPFYIDTNGAARQNWNNGWLFGAQVPLRYESEVDLRLRHGALSLSLDLLLLSDPEFRRDFGTRSEAMDWGFLLNSDGEVETEEGSTVSSLLWESTTSWSPSVPSALRPWVSSFAVSGLTTRLDWRSRNATDLPEAVTRSDADRSPETKFFYPDTLVLPDLQIAMRGTLLQFPRDLPPSQSEPDQNEESSTDTEGETQRELRPPWEEEEEERGGEEARYRLPELAADAPGLQAPADAQFSLAYTVSPSLRYDRFTDNNDWENGDDVGLNWAYSTFQTRTRGSLTATTRDPREYLRLTNRLNMEHRYQEIDAESALTTAEEDQLKLEAFQYRQTTTTQASNLTVFPLQDFGDLSSSSWRYTLNSLVFQREFDRLRTDGTPRYDTRWGDWVEEDVTIHQTEAEFVWNLWNADQRLTATSDLPPRDRSYLGSVQVVTGPLTSRLSGGYRETDEEGWEAETLRQSHRLSLLDGQVTAGQELDYDLNQINLLRARSSLGLWPLSISLEGRRTEGYRFVDAVGWELRDDEAFRWTALSVSADANYDLRYWKRRLNVSLVGSLALNADLQRFTNSTLNLDYGLDLDLYRFLDFRIRARTENDLVYQYIPSLAGRVDRPTRNFFTDLSDSLRLFNTDRRERSFFKLQALDISAVHDLEDWVLQFTYTGQPELEDDGTAYRWSSMFTILLRWRAISELQRSVEVDDGMVEFGTVD